MRHGLRRALVAVEDYEPPWIDFVYFVHRLAEHLDVVLLGPAGLVDEIERKLAVRNALVAASKLAPDALEGLKRHGIAAQGLYRRLGRIFHLARRAVKAEVDVDSVLAPVLHHGIYFLEPLLKPMFPVIGGDEEAIIDGQAGEVEAELLEEGEF